MAGWCRIFCRIAQLRERCRSCLIAKSEIEGPEKSETKNTSLPLAKQRKRPHFQSKICNI